MNWFFELIDKIKFVFLESDRYKQIITGFTNTLKITAGALVLGIVIGIIIRVFNVVAISHQMGCKQITKHL